MRNTYIHEGIIYVVITVNIHAVSALILPQKNNAHRPICYNIYIILLIIIVIDFVMKNAR